MQISCMQSNFTCSPEFTEYAYRDECNNFSMTNISRDIFAQFIIWSLNCFGPKSQFETALKKACDVTVRTKIKKIICVDRVSVRLTYYANFKWHLSI